MNAMIKHTKTGVAACIFAFASIMPSVAVADGLFEKLTGSWRGSGIVTPNAGGARENIRCRLQNIQINKSARMNVLGNCSVGGLLLPVNGWIKASGSNAYSASLFQSLTRLSSNSFRGKLRGNTLNLGYNATDRVSKQKIQARLAIVNRSNGRFDVRISRTDPKTKKLFSVGTIKFKKR